jgi:2-polyprenyl-3-methyl-5-hydroxy-6-metoxy-1,4-benzoquinol methylase
MNWYEEWFNTKEYLEVYKNRDDVEAETLAELILANVKMETDAKILDMAAGAGRHAINFARRGFNVTAVDLSKNLIKVAKKNASVYDFDIDFVHSDIRKFETSDKFDLVLNLFTSIGYFDNDEENFELLRKAYNLLSPGGCFVLDYFNRNYLEGNLIPSSVETINDALVNQNRSIKGDRVIKEIIIKKNDDTKKYFESVRMFSLNELQTELENTGFKIISIFGDLDGKPFVLETSPRVIIIASK